MDFLNDKYVFLRFSRRAEYGVSLLLLAGVTLLCELLQHILLPINFLMIYLVIVLIAALNLSVRPALLVVVLSGFLYNYLYIDPRFSFELQDKEYIETFFGLLLTGIVISSLVTKTRKRSEALLIREKETASLYHLSKELAAAADSTAIQNAVISNIQQSTNNQSALFQFNEGQLLQIAASPDFVIDPQEAHIPAWSLQNGRTAGYGTDLHGSATILCVPLKTPLKTVGVLVVKVAENQRQQESVQINRLIGSFADQMALALERVNLVHEAEVANNLMARQKLEQALLNSVSHDLRTPLATITGVLSSVLEEGDQLSDQVRWELLNNARQEADRLNRFVGKLLDISRIEAKGVIMKIELCDVQELIGCALTAIGNQLDERQINVVLADELPLVPMDMVLLNQVLVNLLENSLKYAPPGSPLEISAACYNAVLQLGVYDQGEGVPETELERIFEKFYRVPVPESIKGTGLGLSICHGIVEAHGGSIRASNQPGGGFLVTVEIPLKTAMNGQGHGHAE